MAKTAIAIDLGGTKIAAALVNSKGELIGEAIKTPTPAQEGGEAILDAMAELIERKREMLGADPAAIGIGAAGGIDADRGVVVNSSGTIKDWIGTDIVGGLRARLPWAQQLPIKVINDADAHAVGECWKGAGAGSSSMFMVAVGTGVGCAFCVNGEVLHGAHHMAGEIGNARIPFTQGPAVTDGDLPAQFERNTAGPAMVKFYAEANGPAADDPERNQYVMDLAEEGDPVAIAVTQELGRRLGEVVSWYVMMLDPEVIVLGGGVPRPGSAWWQAMEARLKELLPPYLQPTVDIRRAQLKNEAAFLGAARDAFRLAGINTK